MIKFSNSDKTLTVVSGLGNFPSNSSGGSDVTRQDVVNIVNSAITEYDAEVQVDLEEIRDNVSGNTEDISALSGTTQDMRSDINGLSGATENIQSNVETISGQTSANTADIATLSGQVDTLSSSTVTGLETAQNTANSANTLASSAYTLADSAYTRADAAYNLAESLTGGTGGPEVILLNKITEQERIALYNKISSCYDQSTASFTTAWTEDLYAFYIDLREHSDQDQYQLNDEYEGFFPMQVTRVHPSDYGGAVFFSGIQGDRYGNGRVVNIRFVINYEGQVDRGTWWNIPVNIGTTCVYIGPNGEFWDHRAADILYSEADIFKIAVKGCTESFSEEWGFGSFVYARRSDTGNGWYYQWSLIVPTNTGVMKGVWHCDESNGGSLGEVSTYVLDSWTAV